MQGVNLVGRGYVNTTRIDVGGTYSWLGAFGRGFVWGKIIFRVWDNNKKLSHPFPGHWGVGRDGWWRGTLDDAF